MDEYLRQYKFATMPLHLDCKNIKKTRIYTLNNFQIVSLYEIFADRIGDRHQI